MRGRLDHVPVKSYLQETIVSAPTMRPVPRPVVEVQERRRSNAAGPHRGQRRGRSACRNAAIMASLIECGEDY